MRVAVSVATVLLCLVCVGNDAGGGQCSYSADCCVWSAGGGQCSYSTAVLGLWW